MAIDLTGIPIRSAEPILQEFGGLLTPAMGGPVQRIERPGSRWALQIETPPMPVEPDGRRWASRIGRAKRAGAVIEIPQPGLVIGAPGAPRVAGAFVGGRLIQLGGLTAGYAVREGQWISIIVAGRRYADQIVGDAAASAGGLVTVALQNLLRVPLAGNEVVEIASPKIEGWLEESFSFPLDVAHMTSFGLTISEAA